MADCARLQRVRGGYRSALTKLNDKIMDCLRANPIDAELLQSLLCDFTNRYDQIRTIDEKIMDIVNVEDIEDEIETTSEYLRKHNSLQTKVQLALAKLTDSGSTPPSPSTTGHSGSNSMRLPKLSLPHFDGDLLQWTAFWESFAAAVHNNESLTGGNKFEYLFAQLHGDAATLVEGFQHTAEAYVEAIALLQKTYGDTQKIVRGHLYRIFDLPSPVCTAKDLTVFRNSYESHLRSLKVLKIDVDAASHVYTALLTRKLPRQTRDNINRATRKTFLNLTEFRSAIDEEIERLSDADEDHAELEHTSESTISSFPAITENTSVLMCQYCDQSHRAADCHIHPTVESRKNIAKSRGLCYNCLARGHAVSQCRSTRSCTICHVRHHTSLCFRGETKRVETTRINYQTERNSFKSQPLSSGATPSNTARLPNTDAGVRRSAQQTNTATSVNLIHSVTSTLLPTAMIGVVSHGTVCYLRTLFDQGAQRSFILKKHVVELGLQDCGTTEMTINGFNTKGQSRLYDVIRIDTFTNDGYVSINAIAVDDLPGNISMHGRAEVMRDIQLSGISLADPYTDNPIINVDLIIGADHYFDYVYTDKINDVAIIPSKIGCLLSGRTPINGMDNSTNTSGTSLVVTSLHIGTTENDNNSDTELARLWSLDTIGIRQDSLSNDEVAAVEDFESNVTYSGSSYTARLPWKADHPVLPTNETLARSRLRGTLARLRRIPDILDHYDTIMRTHLEKEFIEKVDVYSDLADDAKVHYLPHHEVKKDSNTTPIRVVFDCSAKSSPSQPSLNDCLLTGPSLVQELGRMLLLFRLEPFAAIADIEKAFLQVRLAEQDRESTRFLWPDNPRDPASPISTYRFKVVLFGATCSQFLLNATLRHHLGLNASQIAHKLLERLYVDNLQTSENSEDSLVDFYEESRRLLKDAGFVLREWHTNSRKLKSVILQNGDGMVLKSEDDTEVPLLGMRWDSDRDQMTFAKKESRGFDSDPIITKRNVVSKASKMFDPLGWLTPVLIRSRMFIQKLWKSGVDWDEPLPDELCKEWIDINSDLDTVQFTSQQRQVVLTEKTELHCFSDASMSAYGAVIYIVNGTSVHLLIAKSRVTPLRTITLPQLELTAANVAAKLTRYVLNVYKNEGMLEQNVRMWSDSQIVLSWLKSNKPLKTYVRNRVDDINGLLPEANWQYVSTKDNPADLLSRGMSCRAFGSSSLWWQGPEWITHSDTRLCVPSPLASDEAIDEHEAPTNTTHVGSVGVHPNEDIIGIQRFSNIGKLIRVTAYVMKFCWKVGGHIVKKEPVVIDQQSNSHVLTVRDIQKAERYLIREIQKENYSCELAYLRGDRLGPRPNLVKQLRLELFDDVIRCSGRINEADLPWETKCPVLLPPRHHFTKILIHNAHEESKHGGVGVVLTKVRERWWIPTGRQRVKEVIRQCVRCKRQQARPYPTADEPHLPEIRVSDSPPFTVTGVDYTGALVVKDGDATRKVYIALFTCATTRAIHLELVNYNKCETFLRALRRFIARRSCPQYLLSDNSATFVSASKLLEEFSRSSTVQDELLHRRITWKFIPVRAPWFGGFWERLIGLTKSAIKKTVGKSLVDIDELHSLVMEVESIVNNRPLTYLTNDLDEQLPLTPSMLLHGRNLATVAVGEKRVDELVERTQLRDNVSRKFVRSQENRVALRNRWKHEYLTGLREQHAYSRKRPGNSPISVDDIVLIHDDTPRINWNIGRVKSLNVGNDGAVRSVELTTQNGVTVRALQRLYPLESHMDAPAKGDGNSEINNVIDNDDDEIAISVDNNDDTHIQNNQDDNSRVRRMAATKARINIRNWCK